MNVWDGSLFSGPQEFHVNVAPNRAPMVTASDFSAARGQVINASTLFSASDADGDNLLYFFYDNSADPMSGHFTVNGVVQAAGTTFAVTAAQLAQTTFTAGTASSDDLFVNVCDGSTYSGPKEFHVNVPANHAPTVTAPDYLGLAGTGLQRVVRCSRPTTPTATTCCTSSTTTARTPRAATSPSTAWCRPANTTFAVTAAQLAQTTFTAGIVSSDDLFVNVYDGSPYSGPKEFHVNVPANHAPTVTAPDYLGRAGTGLQRVVAVLGQRCRRRHPAVFLLRQQRGPRERPLHGQRRGAGGGHDLRGDGGTAGADHLHGGDSELRRSVRERLRRQRLQRAEGVPRQRSGEPRADGDGARPDRRRADRSSTRRRCSRPTMPTATACCISSTTTARQRRAATSRSTARCRRPVRPSR